MVCRAEWSFALNGMGSLSSGKPSKTKTRKCAYSSSGADGDTRHENSSGYLVVTEFVRLGLLPHSSHDRARPW